MKFSSFLFESIEGDCAEKGSRMQYRVKWCSIPNYMANVIDIALNVIVHYQNGAGEVRVSGRLDKIKSQ